MKIFYLVTLLAEVRFVATYSNAFKSKVGVTARIHPHIIILHTLQAAERSDDEPDDDDDSITP
jgi:hypothetical protein